MNIKPLGDRVVIKMIEPESVTKSGIILPSNTQEQPQIALVVEIGKTERAAPVSPGDKVIISKYKGTDVKIDNENYMILRFDDILAIVK